MTNRPKAIGTAGESAAVKFLRLGCDFPDNRCYRLTLSGAFDHGDIHVEFPDGTVGIIEVKSGKAADHASLADIDRWQREATKEAKQHKANHAFLLVKRNAVAPARVGLWRFFARCEAIMPDAIVGKAWVETTFDQGIGLVMAVHGRHVAPQTRLISVA